MASSTVTPTNIAASAKAGEKSEQTPTKTAATGATALVQQQSPRNTASGGTSGSYGSAGTVSTGTCVQWGPIDVSKALQDGEKFVKWDEVRFSTPYIIMNILSEMKACSLWRSGAIKR